MARLGDAPRRRARLSRPLLPGGVRRAGRRLLLLARPRRVHELLGLGRDEHGLRRPDRHGPAPGPPARHRGAEAALPRAGHQGRAHRLPRDHRARSRVRRRRDPHHRDPRRRRLRDQRVQDLHHQRRPRRLLRAGHEDRPGGGPRRHHAVRGRPARRKRGHRARLHRLAHAREDGHARVRHGGARVRGHARPSGSGARRGRQGLLPHQLGAPGRAAGVSRGRLRGLRADVREDARVREGTRGVRPADRPLPGHPPQVRRDGDQDRGRQADDPRHRLAVRERRVPGARDHDGEAERVTGLPRGRRRVRPDLRRLRLHEGVRDRARLPRPAPEPDRRGHRRDHAGRDRALAMASSVETARVRGPPTRRDRRGGRDPRRRARHLREPRRPRLPPSHRHGRRAAARAVERARREGVPRRQPARALRRRRPGDARLAGGRRGDLRRRLLAAPDRRLARDRRLDPDPPRDRGPARATGCPASPPAPRASRSRSPSPTPAPTRTTSRPPRRATATSTACAARRRSSPASRTRTRSS